MRNLIIFLVVLLIAVGGCGSPLLDFSGGAAAGGLLSNTISGMEKDLEVKESKLIELYNKGVESGAQKEYLDQIEKDIYDVRFGKQTIKTGKELLGVNLQDPTEAGTAVGGIVALVYAYLKRRDLLNMSKKYRSHKQGAENFMRTNNAEGQKLYQAIGEARVINKVT